MYSDVGFHIVHTFFAVHFQANDVIIHGFRVNNRLIFNEVITVEPPTHDAIIASLDVVSGSTGELSIDDLHLTFMLVSIVGVFKNLGY